MYKSLANVISFLKKNNLTSSMKPIIVFINGVKYYVTGEYKIADNNWYFKLSEQETNFTSKEFIKAVETEAKSDDWDSNIYISRFDACTSGEIYFCLEMDKQKRGLGSWDDRWLILEINEIFGYDQLGINVEILNYDVEL